MRLKAPRLVAHSLVLAALIGSPAASAQPSVGASNEGSAHATERGNQVDLFSHRVFGTRDAPWRRLGNFEIDTLELGIPTAFLFFGFRLELERYLVDEVTWRRPLPFDGVDIDEDETLSLYNSQRNVAETKPLKQELKKHHVGVQGGVFNPSTDVIELGNLGFQVEQSDGMTILRYRYSLNPRIDLVAEGRYWIGRGPTAASGEAKVAGGFIGPGIRIHALKGTEGRRVVPYLQGNIYYVQEMLGEPKVLYKNGGIGFGLSGGVDLELTRLISIPIEATYVGNGGGGLDDLSGFGVSVGINFNF